MKTTYSREPWHCGVQREERIVHTFASFRNWLHQNNAPYLISLFNKNTDVNVNSITGTPVSHQYSAWRKKLNLSLKHRNCGHIKGRSWRSIQFGDNHVVCATKVIFNCIIQPINSWKKILVNLLSSALQCKAPHYGKSYQGTITRIYLRELPRKLKQIIFGLY